MMGCVKISVETHTANRLVLRERCEKKISLLTPNFLIGLLGLNLLSSKFIEQGLVFVMFDFVDYSFDKLSYLDLRSHRL